MSQRSSTGHMRLNSARTAPPSSRTSSRKSAKRSKRSGQAHARQRSSRPLGSRDLEADGVDFSSLRASAAGKTIFSFLAGPSLTAMLATSRGWRGYVLRHCRHFHIDSPPLASSSLLASAARSALAFEQLDHIALPVGYMPLGDTALLGPREGGARADGGGATPASPARAEGARRRAPATLAVGRAAPAAPPPRYATLTRAVPPMTRASLGGGDMGVSQLRVRQRGCLSRVRRVWRAAATAGLRDVARIWRGYAAAGRRRGLRRRHCDGGGTVVSPVGPFPPPPQHRHLRLHDRRCALCERHRRAPGPLPALPASRGQPTPQRASAALGLSAAPPASSRALV